jgi:hypothetical protein
MAPAELSRSLKPRDILAVGEDRRPQSEYWRGCSISTIDVKESYTREKESVETELECFRVVQRSVARVKASDSRLKDGFRAEISSVLGVLEGDDPGKEALGGAKPPFDAEKGAVVRRKEGHRPDLRCFSAAMASASGEKECGAVGLDGFGSRMAPVSHKIGSLRPLKDQNWRVTEEIRRVSSSDGTGKDELDRLEASAAGLSPVTGCGGGRYRS